MSSRGQRPHVRMPSLSEGEALYAILCEKNIPDPPRKGRTGYVQHDTRLGHVRQCCVNPASMLRQSYYPASMLRQSLRQCLRQCVNACVNACVNTFGLTQAD